jgi:hypothetical protein
VAVAVAVAVAVVVAAAMIFVIVVVFVFVLLSSSSSSSSSLSSGLSYMAECSPKVISFCKPASRNLQLSLINIIMFKNRSSLKMIIYTSGEQPFLH